MVEEVIEGFPPIHLSQLDSVALMTRRDKKYCIHENKLPALLQQLKQHYTILDISGKKLHEYTNTYFDNPANIMYHDHVRGKLNRYKVRFRDYGSTDLSFLEVKFRTNTGQSVKTRKLCNGERDLSTPELALFVHANTPFHPDRLTPVLQTRFTRITLVNKDLSERCTIDTHIVFEHQHKRKKLEDIAVIEVKSTGLNNDSPMVKALRDMYHVVDGFSKYCLGRTLLDPTLKDNAYKTILRAVKKCQTHYKNKE